MTEIIIKPLEERTRKDLGNKKIRGGGVGGVSIIPIFN